MPPLSSSFTLDRLSSLMARCHVSAHWFQTGALCGEHGLHAEPGQGVLCVLRRGRTVLTHRPQAGAVQHMAVDEPTLFFYSPLMAHRFHHAPQDGADVACAAVHFERCPRHPLVQALPALTVLPLAQVPGLAVTLALLFQEADWARGGQGLIADRLLEVVLLQPQRRWSVAALAAQAAMSRSAFAHRFKQVVGVSPPDCLTDWRMVLAQQLLRQGRPVKWMAPELGYANASALSRVFAQRMGLSPRQWRAKTREGVG